MTGSRDASMEATHLSRATVPGGRATPPFAPPGTVAVVVLGSLGLLIALTFGGAPLYLLALPALIVGTALCVLRPVIATVSLVVLSGFIGTITAYVGIPVDATAAGLLLCLWIAVIGAYLSGRKRDPLWLLPALLPLALYGLISVVQMLASDSLSLAYSDFRITVWYMLAVVLLAIAPWSAETYRRIALGFAATALLVGLYAVYRYVFGESAKEFLQARASVQHVGFSSPVRFFGSFLSAFQLAAWCSTIIPLLLALAFVTRRRWRLVCVAALALCMFAVFASDVRTGLVAALVGLAVVIALFALSRAFSAQRIAAIFVAVIGLFAVGLGGYAAVISGSEARTERFQHILDPTKDFAFQERLTRWNAALDVVDEEPFGYGLGTQGFVGQTKNPEGQTGPFNLDSAYLKVGIQQGYLVMVLFVFAQLALLVGIAHRAVHARDRWRAALGVGACGTLVAQMIMYFNGIYSEGVTSLAAWMAIGIGAAQFTSLTRLGDDAPAAAVPEGPPVQPASAPRPPLPIAPARVLDASPAEPPVTLLSVIQGPAFGGAHNQALRLRPLLERHGISTVVALPEEAEAAAGRLRDAGVETVTLPLRRLRASANPMLQARFMASIPGDVRRLRELIRAVGADVVQVHGVTNGHGAAAARREGAALVWQLFDTRAPMLLRRTGMPAVVRTADVITTWGDELARVHPGAIDLGSRLITVYPPVDGAEFAPDAAARKEARMRLEISDDEILIASIGVLNPQKGHEYLVRAAELIRKEHPAARFAIFGGTSPAHGDYERGLREEARARGLADHFAFVDPGTDVAHLLQAIDIFAMTSVPRSEGMPTVILEAMNCRKPIVTTRVGAVEELVEDDASALIVEPENPQLIADAISRLLRDSDLRQRLAVAGFERAHSRFDLERLAALHAGAYRLALRRRAKTAS